MLKGFTRSSISPQLCSLYFKGLVGDDSLAGFGVAICGHRDDILFQLNAPIHGSDITVLEAELMALKRGLIEAAGFKSSFTIFVEGSSIRYVSELARATIVSELSISVDPPSSSLNGIEKLKLEDVIVWNVVNPYASTAKFGKSENVASMWKVPTHDRTFRRMHQSNLQFTFDFLGCWIGVAIRFATHAEQNGSKEVALIEQ
ncbi:hypothetical protein [Arabidopsis thaliana]|uniref:Uncharacterized protein F9K21.80 n=1 Tax=Arabidopsis thaliana TaxID=3702 RepID=Q9M1F7_ARATH|nr:uncharacterized protein AT3G45500 [Arabidopsis thaliana]AEE78037.1 hypothetical protein AT3G45500 [Arabidopsis thaliana]CAB75479.1 hypothetical protein [Arabidopsis thaliana]|eukprot:NP_190136.1 hypothetical protein AT3G45500 [Arabidopsis thaliana]